MQEFSRWLRKLLNLQAESRRADAQRNCERILEEAKKEFIKSGANASLEEIAKKAGVGPGTFCRHFPTT